MGGVLVSRATPFRERFRMWHDGTGDPADGFMDFVENAWAWLKSLLKEGADCKQGCYLPDGGGTYECK